MKYIDAIKGSIFALIIFAILVTILPGGEATSNIQTILTVSTFLFAILSGFFVSRLNDRYNKIRELIGSEDSLLFSLYKIAKLYGSDFSNAIKEKIDNYYLISFDNEITNYYTQTLPSFNEIFDTLFLVKKYRRESSYAQMLHLLASLKENRNKNFIIGQEKLTKSQWIVLFFLISIILYCLFYLNNHEPYFQVLLVLLATISILVLLTIRDLQNLRLGGKIIPVFESGEEVLESLGNLRYYNHLHLKNGLVEIPKYVKKYRLGLHLPGEKPKIKIVKV